MKYPHRTFRRLRDAWHSRVWEELCETMVRSDLRFLDIGIVSPDDAAALFREADEVDDMIDKVDSMSPDDPRYDRWVSRVRRAITRIQVRAMECRGRVEYRLLLN